MEALFINKTQMKRDEVISFQSNSLKSTLILLSIIMTLIFVGLGIGLCFINLTLGIILVVIGAVAGIWLLPYLMKQNLKSGILSSVDEEGYEMSYEFYNDNFKIINEIDNEEITLEYGAIKYITAYKQGLLLYFGNNTGFILKYDSMRKGTIKELASLFTDKQVKIKDKSNGII